VALLLRRRGIERVRPLHGGFDAWRDHGLPIESEEGLPVEPTRIEKEPGAIPESLDDAMVVDETGAAVRLADTWRDRPVVLAFVRHFGCPLCHEFAVALQQSAEAIREAGADVIVVGHGQPEGAARFRTQFELAIPVLVDRHRHIFELLGFRRNLGGTANPLTMLLAFRAWRRGARQGWAAGDPWQLGGVLIVQPGGEISYRHESRYAGDHPKIEALLAELRGTA